MLDLLQVFAGVQVGDVGELEVDQADQALVVVLDPVVQLLEQQLVLRRQLGVQLVQAGLLDREGEQRGVALQELEVVLGEGARLATVGLEHAENVLLGLDDHVGRALDAVLPQQLGEPEPLLLVQLVGDHRASGLERVAGGGFDVGADPHLADHALAPADARAHQQALLVGQVLQHLDVAHVQAARRLSGRLLQQPVEVGALDREQAEIRELGPFLAQPFLGVVRQRAHSPDRCAGREPNARAADARSEGPRVKRAPASS